MSSHSRWSSTTIPSTSFTTVLDRFVKNGTTPPGLFVIKSPFSHIATNLAIEESLLRALTFSRSTRILLLYVNSPAVVVGRYQNVWLECNVPRCRDRNVTVQRRQSGGGTVYHDGGTLCMSFLTSKQDHQPQKNMEFLARVLRDSKLIHPDTETVIGDKRHDLFLRRNNSEDVASAAAAAAPKKISGSAMRITGRGAYHHCTMLCDAELDRVRSYLRFNSSPTYPFYAPTITSNKATDSVRSPVTSLSVDTSRRVLVEEVSEVVEKAFLNQNFEHTNTSDDAAISKGLQEGDAAAEFVRESITLQEDIVALKETTFVEPPRRERSYSVGSLVADHKDPAFVYGGSPPFSFEQRFVFGSIGHPDESSEICGVLIMSVERGGTVGELKLKEPLSGGGLRTEGSSGEKNMKLSSALEKMIMSVLESLLLGKQFHCVGLRAESEQLLEEAVVAAVPPDSPDMPLLRGMMKCKPGAPTADVLVPRLVERVMVPIFKSAFGAWAYRKRGNF